MLEAVVKLPQIRVLIVDDSKLARIKLKKMLEAEDPHMQIDMVESAEAALDYLTSEQPEVIFLDHNMPGMSGLAALKIIKANPATATIPIMMYTSESDDVYLGKARALGAFDVLVKENLQAGKISKRFNELKLKPRLQQQNKVFDVKVYDGANRANQFQNTDSRYLKGRLRVVEHSEKLATVDLHGKESVNDDTGFHRRPDDFRPAEIKTDDMRTNWWLPLVVFLSGVILAVGIAKYFNTSSIPAVANDITNNIHDKVVQEPVKQVSPSAVIRHTGNTAETNVEPTLNASNNVANNVLFDPAPLFDALTWAMGQRMEYAYDEQPLGGGRLDELRTMLSYLESAGFRGEVNLIVHQGDYCLNQANDGRQYLPESNSSFNDCVMIEARPGDQLLSDLQSVEFARFLSTSSLANGAEGITVNVASAENDSILYPYPYVDSNLTAGKWNSIAAKNNTIEVVIRRY